ncbi:DDE-type integrase/transposase/recombinase [Sedimentitalea sp. JM2-8]|uniref:DDE-type integrase/transposase/recombinase n=1 Tax=Sedimentitalea xiamensis TaxID=3050037 RepID=A0ABT7FKQ7_9RHOB|nr:DDE-type integrase/transposase/recombinase [Sedimentitalea xiamensis]MDK3075746.1 DDE-type integrase/transposase/recombinase [Sedimentitalea xiamensis]
MADLTYVTISGGFAYVALILDAWSRRVVGYAIGRKIDARLAVQALRHAIALRQPLPGCVFHTDRGSQYASEMHRALLAQHGLVGSMRRAIKRRSSDVVKVSSRRVRAFQPARGPDSFCSIC